MCEETVKRTEYDGYIFPNGWTMKRERKGKTPGGNHVNSRWVLRNEKGDWIDVDQYRNDLAERHKLDLSADNVIKPDKL